MDRIITRIARLKAGQCPLHEEKMRPVSGIWMQCPHKDCGILGLQAHDGIQLPMGWQFLINRESGIVIK